jgi:tetratricopeptide (TPR) repeat protein
MSPAVRSGLLSASAVFIVAGAFGSVHVYRSGDTDRAAAVRHVKSALQALNAPGAAPSSAIARYRGELLEAERLLQRSLLADPTDTISIQRLAAVLWELASSAGENDQASLSDLVQLAAARTPHRPETQIELGELLYRVGRVSDATQRFAGALALDPTLARRVVELMLSFGSSPSEIAGALPASPELLVSLEAPFLEAGLDSEFAALVDGSLNSWPRELLSMYGDLCLRTGRSDEILTRLGSPFPSRPPHVESLRLVQRARALAALGRHQSALAEAREARDLAPRDPAILEAVGEIAYVAGDAKTALADLRDALASLTLEQASPLTVGRVYRKLGQAEELAGEPERAVDAYHRAIHMNPSEALARLRLAEMEAAAGLRP